MQYNVKLIFTKICIAILWYVVYLCDNAVCGNDEVWNCHCEWNGSVAKKWNKIWWLGRAKAVSWFLQLSFRHYSNHDTTLRLSFTLAPSKLTLQRAAPENMWGSDLKQYLAKRFLQVWRTTLHVHKYSMPRLFTLRVCSFVQRTEGLKYGAPPRLPCDVRLARNKRGRPPWGQQRDVFR